MPKAQFHGCDNNRYDSYDDPDDVSDRDGDSCVPAPHDDCDYNSCEYQGQFHIPHYYEIRVHSFHANGDGVNGCILHGDDSHGPYSHSDCGFYEYEHIFHDFETRAHSIYGSDESDHKLRDRFEIFVRSQ